jgi:hypothetical protein
MYLPKLSDQEIGCYYSKSPITRIGVDHPNASKRKAGQGQVDDVSRQLAELKAKQNDLRQTLRKVGEQLLVLTQSSGNPASMSGQKPRLTSPNCMAANHQSLINQL